MPNYSNLFLPPFLPLSLHRSFGFWRLFKDGVYIPVMGVLRKATSLFDPRVDVLKDIFGDEREASPMGEFEEDGWLDLLGDVGLRNKVNRETILLCAKKVIWLVNGV